MLAPVHIEDVIRRFPGVGAVQAVIRRRTAGDELELLFVLEAEDDVPERPDELCQALLAAASDVQDSVRHGVIAALGATRVAPEALFRTRRGKTPLIWLEESGV